MPAWLLENQLGEFQNTNARFQPTEGDSEGQGFPGSHWSQGSASWAPLWTRRTNARPASLAGRLSAGTYPHNRNHLLPCRSTNGRRAEGGRGVPKGARVCVLLHRHLPLLLPRRHTPSAEFGPEQRPGAVVGPGVNASPEAPGSARRPLTTLMKTMVAGFTREEMGMEAS